MLKIFLILIATGVLVGLMGTIICFGIDSFTNIDADRAMMVFFTITIASFALFVMFGILALVLSIWTTV